MGIPLSHPPRFVRRKRSNSTRRSKSSSTPSQTSFETEISQFYGGSSVLDAFRYIEGRRYHNSDTRYCFPIDNDELNRMRLSHNVFKNTWGANFSAPVADKLSEGGVHVFDIGCGPGMWCLEMSRDYPKSTFIGLDISATFSLNEKPPNVGYLECDALGGLPFPNETFHYCWQKFMVSSFTHAQWVKQVKEMARVTKRGGWVEIMEVDLDFGNLGPSLRRLLGGCRRYYVSRNLIPLISEHIARFLKDTEEFDEIIKEERVTGIGAWAGERGEQAALNVEQAYQSLKPVVRPMLAIDEDAYDDLVNSIKRESSIHRTYLKTYRFYAQRRSNLLSTPYY